LLAFSFIFLIKFCINCCLSCPNKKGLPLFYKSKHPKKKQTAKRVFAAKMGIRVAVNKTFLVKVGKSQSLSCV